MLHGSTANAISVLLSRHNVNSRLASVRSIGQGEPPWSQRVAWEICTVRAAMRPGLRCGVSASVRENSAIPQVPQLASSHDIQGYAGIRETPRVLRAGSVGVDPRAQVPVLLVLAETGAALLLAIITATVPAAPPPG